MTRAFRCRWACEELEIPYEAVEVDLRSGEHRGEEYRKLNPYERVPTLVDGDLVLTESAAICTYLAEKNPEKGLVPRVGTVDRARYDQWMFFCMSELDSAVWNVAKHKFALPEERRVPAEIETARWEFGVAARRVAAGLAGRSHILGERFSAADILIGHTLLWGERAKALDRADPAFGGAIASYLERLTERAAFRRALAIKI